MVQGVHECVAITPAQQQVKFDAIRSEQLDKSDDSRALNS